MKYVGPPYKKALVMPDGLRADPANMTNAQAKAFMRRYPGRDQYFEKPAPKKAAPKKDAPKKSAPKSKNDVKKED